MMSGIILRSHIFELLSKIIDDLVVFFRELQFFFKVIGISFNIVYTMKWVANSNLFYVYKTDVWNICLESHIWTIITNYYWRFGGFFKTYFISKELEFRTISYVQWNLHQIPIFLLYWWVLKLKPLFTIVKFCQNYYFIKLFNFVKIFNFIQYSDLHWSAIPLFSIHLYKFRPFMF